MQDQNTLKIVTLNMGRGFPGFDRMRQFLAEQNPDVLLLQDVRADHISAFPAVFGPSVHFAPMCRHFFQGGIGWVPVGVAICSKHPLNNLASRAYVGNVLPVQDLAGTAFDDKGASYATDLDMVRQTESRIAIFADVVVPDCIAIRIGTTHGVWTPGGKVDDHQRRSMRVLRRIMEEELFDGGVVAGDFNAHISGEIGQVLNESSGYGYRMPHDIVTTVDWVMRGKSGPNLPNLVVDHIYATYVTVAGQRVHFGVSDHAALSFEVSLVPTI